MAVPISADEVFEMACQIERNGAAFYRRAAGNTEDANAREILNGLAEMEDDHERTFAAMKARFAAQGGVVQADAQANLYLRALADGRVFNVKGDPAAGLRGRESLPDVLRTAIGLEKDSIVFYVGIRRAVVGTADKERVEAVIAEEMKHIAVLGEQLANLPGAG